MGGFDSLGECLESRSCRGWWYQQERKVQRLNLRMPQPGPAAVMLVSPKCSGSGAIQAGTQTPPSTDRLWDLEQDSRPLSMSSENGTSCTNASFPITLGCCGNPMRSCLWARSGNYRSITPLQSYKGYHLIFITWGECGSLLLSLVIIIVLNHTREENVLSLVSSVGSVE